MRWTVSFLGERLALALSRAGWRGFPSESAPTLTGFGETKLTPKARQRVSAPSQALDLSGELTSHLVLCNPAAYLFKATRRDILEPFMPQQISARIEAIKAKKQALEQKLSALEQKAKTEARKLDTRRKIIVGGLVLGYMEKDPAFADLVRGLIASGVSRPHDVAAVAALLPPELVAKLTAASEKAPSPAADDLAPAQNEFRHAATG